MSVPSGFAFETTLSGLGYARQIPKWRKAGYFVDLVFLKLSRVEIAIERVGERVKQGGHHIPEDVIRRRFTSGLSNFDRMYKPIVDQWELFDNTGTEPISIEKGSHP